MYAVDLTYREFLEELEENSDAGTSPDIVLLAANDGMLHAFQLEDDASLLIPKKVKSCGLGCQDTFWNVSTMQKSGRGVWSTSCSMAERFLFDGSPVVEDVWIDADGDGIKDCDSVQMIVNGIAS